MDDFDALRAHMHKRFDRLEDTLDRGFDRLEATIDREFAVQRRILTGLALLTITAIVVSAILDGGGS